MQITAYQNIRTTTRNSILCYCYLSYFGNWQGNDLVTEIPRKIAKTPNFNYTQIAELQQCYPIRFLSFLTPKDYDLFT